LRGFKVRAQQKRKTTGRKEKKEKQSKEREEGKVPNSNFQIALVNGAATNRCIFPVRQVCDLNNNKKRRIACTSSINALAQKRPKNRK
jgi:hypothetical protein